jgi:hypothetical protein
MNEADLEVLMFVNNDILLGLGTERAGSSVPPGEFCEHEARKRAKKTTKLIRMINPFITYPSRRTLNLVEQPVLLFNYLLHFVV